MLNFVSDDHNRCPLDFPGKPSTRRPPFPPRSSMANLRPPKRSENDSPMQMGVAWPLNSNGTDLAVFGGEAMVITRRDSDKSEKFPN